MKRFLLLLTFYSIILLSVSMLTYYFLLIKPSLKKLEANLEHTAQDVSKLDQTVTAIKQTTDRLEARASSYKPTSSLSKSISSTADATESATLAAARELDSINLVIDQKLKTAGTSPVGVGGVIDTTLLTNPLVTTPDPTPPTDMALGFITVGSSLWPTIDVFQSQSTSSKIFGQIKQGNVYPFLAETPDWYQVRISSSIVGWVQKVMVKLTDGL